MSQLQDIALWDEEYILSLQVGEPDWLDFKQSEWFTLDNECFDKLSKYLSAFSNYDGGYIVVGVKNPQDGQPVEIDGGVKTDVKPKLKDWLEDKLPNLADPKLEKIGVRLIVPVSPDSKIKPGNCLVVIYIPESTAAPHQATDRKYYSRVGSKLNPLKHRAVLDILSRRQHPKLELGVRINMDVREQKSVLHWRLKNVGRVAAQQYQLIFRVPHIYEMRPFSFPKTHGLDIRLQRDDADGPIYWRLVASNRLDVPLFPGADVEGWFPFDRAGMTLTFPPTIPDVQYLIYADDMPVEEGRVPLANVIHSFDSALKQIG